MLANHVRKEIEARLSRRGAAPLVLPEREVAPPLSCGIPQVDAVLGGLPRGAITEVAGAPSSGRTSFLFSALAATAARGEACALLDAYDCFDPESAEASGLQLDRLLWVRCAGRLDWVLKAADLALEGGGWGLVALDLAGDSTADPHRHNEVARIPSSYWYRFRRAIQTTPTALVIVTPRPLTGSSAALALETTRERGSGNLLEGARYRVRRIRPLGARAAAARFECLAAATAGIFER